MKTIFSLIIIIFFCFVKLSAQDSLNSVKKSHKWNLSFTIDNNYNYRYVRVPSGNDNSNQKRDYLDTCNIACSMKTISGRIERKIWRFISLQSGFIYGQKGYIGCRDIIYGDFGKRRVYYTNMPFYTISLPIGVVLNKSFMKNKFILSFNTGIELNYTFNFNQGSSSTINKAGFFGIQSKEKINIQIPYESNEAGTVSFSQHYLGLNFKFIIFKNTFINMGYNYVSDFKFYKVADYLDVRTYVYERKSFIHRYGGGIGFMF